MAKTNTDFQNKFSNFKDRIRTEAPEVPLQTVVPTKPIVVKQQKEVDEQLGLRLPKSMIKQLKLHALEMDLSIKDVVVLCINKYLTNI